MIEIRNLSYGYSASAQQDQVLHDLSLSVQDGELLAIIGSNGSGKSTLAKHLNGLLVPSSGQVLIDGLDTDQEENIWQIRQKVGMVFQNPDNQIVAAVVEEDIAFGPENLGLPAEQIRQRVRAALDMVGMNEYRHFSPHLLSGGQKQKIAIAGALAMGSKYLVLDEPTAMLDPVGRQEVLAVLQDLKKNRGMTIILITHYMEEAAQADKILVMEAGHIVLEGAVADVFLHIEELKKLGLDVPPMTEIAFLLRKAGLSIPADIFTVDEMVKNLCPYL